MSLIDPLTCGFAKVAVFNIFSTKLDLPKDEGEKSNEYKGKVLKHSVRWGINPPSSKTPPPLFLPRPLP